MNSNRRVHKWSIAILEGISKKRNVPINYENELLYVFLRMELDEDNWFSFFYLFICIEDIARHTAPCKLAKDLCSDYILLQVKRDSVGSFYSAMCRMHHGTTDLKVWVITAISFSCIFWLNWCGVSL